MSYKYHSEGNAHRTPPLQWAFMIVLITDWYKMYLIAPVCYKYKGTPYTAFTIHDLYVIRHMTDIALHLVPLV
ncbi:hypothetical protein IscW_ISCW005969 [Ixodes scapularis]|uniref:Uncharacterized protein n=1 Tax=Ixodes scapularis TaxID=6945 RepID=B7PMI8_IXOSC|nr:hypothetical protein IscW_ISCW005969 [Ixodes scapularis]|eukprot:XP_002434986.1 hypothetical protein IscW_ISCW005969 [Ixodes scapularis]